MIRADDLATASALPDDLADALARAGSRGGPFAARLRYFSEVTSTNDIAARLADAGAEEGTTVVAGAQRAGRGRLGRQWYSPAGAGLYVSIVLRPATASADAVGDRLAATVSSLLTIMAGVGVAEALREVSGLAVEIKWPNDVIVRRRKVGGILAEGSLVGDVLQHVVLGVGVNLRAASYPPEVAARATALEVEMGRPVDRGAVLVEILGALATRYEDLRDDGAGAMLDSWRGLSPSSQGALVEWDGPAGVCRGRTRGIDERGALVIESEDGLARVIAGEVRWMRED